MQPRSSVKAAKWHSVSVPGRDHDDNLWVDGTQLGHPTGLDLRTEMFELADPCAVSRSRCKADHVVNMISVRLSATTPGWPAWLGV